MDEKTINLWRQIERCRRRVRGKANDPDNPVLQNAVAERLLAAAAVRTAARQAH